jgi:hypothetical protein
MRFWRRATLATASLRLPGMRRLDSPGIAAQVSENPPDDLRILD